MMYLPKWILQELNKLNFSKEETLNIWKTAEYVGFFSDRLTNFNFDTNKQKHALITLAINVSNYLETRYSHLNSLNTRQVLDEITKFPELKRYNTSDKYAFALLQYCVTLRYLKNKPSIKIDANKPIKNLKTKSKFYTNKD